MLKISLLASCLLCSVASAASVQEHISTSCRVSTVAGTFKMSLFVYVDIKYPKSDVIQSYYKQIACLDRSTCMLTSYAVGKAGIGGMGNPDYPMPMSVRQTTEIIRLGTTGEGGYEVNYSPQEKRVEIIDKTLGYLGTGVGVGACRS